MRNYLYIPLGGNRVDSKKRLFFNLWFVFLLSGFWHGAAWTFIFWGAYHGVMLILERLFLLKIYERLGKIIPTIITFFLVALGWVFFRADTFSYGFYFILKLFSFNNTINYIYLNNEFWFYILLAIAFSFFTLFKYGEKIQNMIYFKDYTTSGYLIGTILSIAFFTICLASISSSTFNPFIYFRF